MLRPHHSLLKPFFVASIALALSFSTAGVLAQAGKSPYDDVFLALREGALKNNVAQVDKLAAQIPSQYPLHAFAEYWQLKVRQPDIGDNPIKAFMARYEGQFVADRLRNDWLLMLGRRGDWKQFDEQHPKFALADDPQVDCYALASQASQGIAVKAQSRDALLRNPAHTAGEGCMALVNLLQQTRQFNTIDLWDVAHVLAEGKRYSALLPLAGLINTSPKDLESAVQASNKAGSHYSKPLTQLSHAAQARGGLLGYPTTSPHVAVQGAASCAQKMGNDCNQWFNGVTLPATVQGLGSDAALEWSIRGALRAQDWALVAALCQRLPAYLQQDAAWTYWHAKALTQLKHADKAQPLYERIAGGWGFYNLLAREALGQPTAPLPLAQLEHSAMNGANGANGSNEADVNAVMRREEVQRMSTFYRLGLRWEGNREWNWMVRSVGDEQLATYAEAGRRLGHLDRMINTADRAKTGIDFKQRYPMPHIALAQPIADSLGLDTNWVYGLMRQESRFVVDVRSSVSARGLMQVMPATAAFVARKINLPGYTPDRISEPEVNLTLGHHYLAMVLSDLDHSPLLATAAYNAGPGRPRAWRATLNHSVEGAIFAETIPFNETRGYVKQVFANAVLYGAVTGNKPRSLSAWLGVVAPKGMTTTTLP
jgi:soluble lytic murein transglycosylase